MEEIRDLWEAGESLSTRNISRLGYSGMVTAAYRPELFGSWREAVRAAGLDPQEVFRRRRKWTRERILSRIRQLHAAGCDISYAAARRKQQYLVVAASSPRFFGSWKAAVEAAGIDYTTVSKRKRWSRERIIEQIREIGRESSRLRLTDVRRSHSALAAAATSPRYFGSWRAALEAAGIRHRAIAGRRVEPPAGEREKSDRVG